ncbi:MAG: hypothetical protein BWY78_01049 [Alphaproteobacteria bacterium ADurb.Bin438]|nr:MAG: hypothetical protein BWY78_01049 [Alphaproteobacteria bacterium ADurb.Bin438]
MKKILIISLIALVSSCSSSKTTYYWEKNGAGPDQFGRDHDYCMDKADYFPYNSEKSWFGPETQNIRPNFSGNKGTWASYVPFKGAQPIYVNYDLKDNTVVSSYYSKCMKDLGYVQKQKPYTGREIGTLNCNSVNCDRSDYENGIYKSY